MTATRAAQEAFLRGFHDRRPGATAAAFAACTVADGRSSYQVLADHAAPGQRVLDLGAGDGHLLGLVRARGLPVEDLVALDLSAGELRAARARGLPCVQARAQALPLATAAFELALSHLAFTLMPEPEAILGELARVLAPGGRFVTLVGGGPRGDDAFAGFLDLLAPRARAAPIPRLGELRARSDAGLAALFSPVAGFAALTVTDLPLSLAGTADEVWARLEPSYEVATLPPAEVAALRADFLAAAPRWRRADGAIACTVATRLVVAIRG